MNAELLLEKLKTYPLAIICSVLGLACALGIYFRSSFANELSIQETDLSAKVRLIEENVKNAFNLKEQVEELSALTKQIDERLFYPQQKAININFFYKVQEQYGVDFSAMTEQSAAPIYSKGGPRELSLYSTMVYNLALTSSFGEVLELMHGLEESNPLIRIGSFRVADAGGEAKEDKVNAALNVIILSAKN